MDELIIKYYKPIHFRVEEFLPPEIYNEYGEKGLQLFMDSRILWTMDSLREAIAAPITINDYCFGGHIVARGVTEQFTQRGFRTDPKIGAKYSQHRYGRGCDFDIKGITSEQFRHMAVCGDYPAVSSALRYITRIENRVNWCHIDCAAVPGVGPNNNGIIFF